MLRPICNGCLQVIHPDEDYVLDPSTNGLPIHACCYTKTFAEPSPPLSPTAQAKRKKARKKRKK